MIEANDEQQTSGDYQAIPDSGNGAGVLVLHAWWGLTPFIKSTCDRLAQAGYTVLAPDLYDGKTAATIAEANAKIRQLDWEAAGAKVEKLIETLHSLPGVTRPEIGLLGFSLGGNFAQSLAQNAESGVAASVIFYDALEGDYSASPSAFQYHWAETDEYLDAGADTFVQERLPAWGKVAEFYTYPGTGHWFFESDRPDAYNPEAASLAWDRTLAFFDKYLLAK